jgi:hypothetical protein
VLFSLTILVADVNGQIKSKQYPDRLLRLTFGKGKGVKP